MRVQQNTAALGAACFIEAAWVKRKKMSKKLGKDSERQRMLHWKDAAINWVKVYKNKKKQLLCWNLKA